MPRPDRGFPVLDEMVEHALDRLRDEKVVPVDPEQGRHPHPAEVETLSREVGQVEELDHDLLGESQQFEERGPVPHPRQVRDRFLDEFAVLEEPQGHEGVDLGPDRGRLEEGEAAEGSPAARLAPHRDPDHVRGVAQLDRDLLVVAADKAGILAASLVFPRVCSSTIFGRAVTKKFRFSER